MTPTNHPSTPRLLLRGAIALLPAAGLSALVALIVTPVYLLLTDSIALIGAAQ